MKVDDILKVTFIEQTNSGEQAELSCLNNVEVASHLFVQMVDTTNEDLSYDPN